MYVTLKPKPPPTFDTEGHSHHDDDDDCDDNVTDNHDDGQQNALLQPDAKQLQKKIIVSYRSK